MYVHILKGEVGKCEHEKDVKILNVNRIRKLM